MVAIGILNYFWYNQSILVEMNISRETTGFCLLFLSSLQGMCIGFREEEREKETWI